VASIIEVTRFLRHFREAIDAKGLNFIPRQINRDGIAKLGLTVADVRSVIYSLKYKHYCGGPEIDQDGSSGEVWIFSTIIGSQSAYIKLKLDKALGVAKCLSFHPAEHSIKQPYNFGGEP
jgi:hypothetical protein